jgi:hypothetical protein
MIEVKTVLFLVIVHFLADFALQTNNQATKKSTSNLYLSYHVGMYALTWFFAMWAYHGSWLMAMNFALITFSAHWVTDYTTSRISKKFFDAQDYHNGFVVVGFDQVLHYVQLLVTYVGLANMIWSK